MADHDQRAPDEWRRAAYDQLVTGIEQLPADAIGGRPAYDPADNRTWQHSPHKDEQAFFHEFIGEEAAYEGLAPAQKQFLYEHGARQIDSVSAGQVETSERLGRVRGKVLMEYTTKYGEPEDPAALERAAQRVWQQYGEDALDLAEQRPGRMAEMLYEAEMDSLAYGDDSDPDAGGSSRAAGMEYRQTPTGGDTGLRSTPARSLISRRTAARCWMIFSR